MNEPTNHTVTPLTYDSVRFKASLDVTSKIITGITLLFSVLALAFAVNSYRHHNLAALIPPLLFVAIIIFTWSYRPRYYEVTATDLIIHRQVTPVIIPRADIVSVITLDKSMLAGTIRTFGVGGVFGYFGNFSIPKTGTVKAYATNPKNAVLVITDKKKILLSPDEAAAFLKALQV